MLNDSRMLKLFHTLQWKGRSWDDPRDLAFTLAEKQRCLEWIAGVVKYLPETDSKEGYTPKSVIEKIYVRMESTVGKPNWFYQMVYRGETALAALYAAGVEL